MRQVPLLLPEGQKRAATVQPARGQSEVAPGESGNTIRLSSLPALLAGPILRRCGPDEVVVWLATSVPMTVAGRVLDMNVDANGRASGSPREIGRGRNRPVQLATNLFVTHLSLRPTTGSTFPRLRILGYDLTFIAPPGYRFTGAAGLVPKAQITYGDFNLPTFLLDFYEARRAPPEPGEEGYVDGIIYTREDGDSPPSSRTVFIHGSCRKLHGPGPDMASKLDDAIAQTHTHVDSRPRFLLLTGDQIYADDVGEHLQRPLMRASRLLLGFRDLLPNTVATLDGITHRSALVRDDAGFTSGEAHRHLIGFGEYAAIYLFAWSPAIWDCPPIREISAAARRENYDDAVCMRRAMANVPCYMMVDDHEITDDWPLDQEMVRAVEGSRYGNWIVANGTTAAFFFQLQGNRDRRGRGAYSQVASALRAYIEKSVEYEAVRASYSAMEEETGSVTTELQNARIACDADLIGIRREYTRRARSIRGMHALAPTVPPVLLLDTRSHRQLTSDNPPGLLNSAARRWIGSQLVEVNAAGRPRDVPLLVVSPAPVVGNPRLESAQTGTGVLGHLHRDWFGSSRYALDCEAWSLNPANLALFLRTIRAFGRKTVFISGDVHYAFTARGTFGGTAFDDDRLEFAQMTGSAMRNHPEEWLQLGTLATTPFHGELQSGESLSYEFTSSNGIETLIAVNNVSRAVVDWSGARLRVTHTIITSSGENLHEVMF